MLGEVNVTRTYPMVQKAEEKERRELGRAGSLKGWIKGVISSPCDEKPLENPQKGHDLIYICKDHRLPCLEHGG